MDLPIADFIEQAVSRQVNGLIGSADTNMNTIVKMALMHELRPIGEERVTTVLQTMTQNNRLEAAWYDREMGMTLDASGNIVSANGKEGEDATSPTDSGGELSESRPGE